MVESDTPFSRKVLKGVKNDSEIPVTAIKLCASNVHLLTNRKAVEAIDKGFPQLYAVLSFTFVVKTIDPAIMME